MLHNPTKMYGKLGRECAHSVQNATPRWLKNQREVDAGRKASHMTCLYIFFSLHLVHIGSLRRRWQWKKVFPWSQGSVWKLWTEKLCFPVHQRVKTPRGLLLSQVPVCFSIPKCFLSSLRAIAMNKSLLGSLPDASSQTQQSILKSYFSYKLPEEPQCTHVPESVWAFYTVLVLGTNFHYFSCHQTHTEPRTASAEQKFIRLPVGGSLNCLFYLSPNSGKLERLEAYGATGRG